MPALDRAWFNSLVDDSGAGLDGTVWNKHQIDLFMDTIDAAFAQMAADPPINHASRHASTGEDPVDVTTLGGFPGGTTLFLRADRTFAPAGGGGAGPNFTEPVTITNNTPGSANAALVLIDPSAPADQHRFALVSYQGSFVILAQTDAGGVVLAATLTFAPDGTLFIGNDRIVLAVAGGFPGGTSTFLRADGTFAPAGDVSAAGNNTFTGVNTFTQLVRLSGLDNAHANYIAENAAANQRGWGAGAYADGLFWIFSQNDDGTDQLGGEYSFSRDGVFTIAGKRALAVTGGFPGGTSTFLRADGTFATPTGGGTPAPHAASHAAGGSDPVSVLTLAGFPGGSTQFLRADGTFATPAGGGGGGGDVVGPASAIDEGIVRFDGTTGKVIASHPGPCINDAGAIYNASDLYMSGLLSAGQVQTSGAIQSGEDIFIPNSRTIFFRSGDGSKWISLFGTNSANAISFGNADVPYIYWNALILPSPTATRDLGHTDFRWKDGWFSGTITAGAAALESAAPYLRLTDTSQGANAKTWYLKPQPGGSLGLFAADDGGSAQAFYTFQRDGGLVVPSYLVVGGKTALAATGGFPGGTSTFLRGDGTFAAPAGGGTSKPFLTFTPQRNQPPATNYATLALRNAHPVLEFVAATDTEAIFGDVLPPSYAGGGITLDVWVVFATATSGTARWQAAFERMPEAGASIDADSFGAFVAAATGVPGTSGSIAKFSIVFSNADIDGLLAGEAFRLKIRRDADGTTGADTAAGVAQLLRVTLREP